MGERSHPPRLIRLHYLILFALCVALFHPQKGVAQTSDVTRRQGILRAMPQSLLNRLAAGTAQEVIVEFDSADTEAEASAIREQKRLVHDDGEIIAFKSRRFRQIKKSVLAEMPAAEADVLIDYKHLPMAALRLRSRSALTRLLEFTDVAAVYENGAIYPHLAQSLPLINQLQAASAGYKGAGAAIAVIDTGVNYKLAEFGSCTTPGYPSGCRVVAAVEIATDDGSLDDTGHGTNVSAIVAGVAPEAELVVLDVFNGDGSSSNALVNAAIDWVIDKKAAYNIVAINMSLGDSSRVTSPCSGNNPFLTPVNQARSAGILPVASSGNNGYTDGICRPACTPGVVSVGAVYDSSIGGVSYGACSDMSTAADQVICFSNSASFLTMLAPGAAITAGGYTRYGTSMAAPHVAGAIAVLRAVYVSESLDTIVGRLTASGHPVTDPRNSVQKPRLDVYGALGVTPAAVPALSGLGLGGFVLALILLGIVARTDEKGRPRR